MHRAAPSPRAPTRLKPARPRAPAPTTRVTVLPSSVSRCGRHRRGAVRSIARSSRRPELARTPRSPLAGSRGSPRRSRGCHAPTRRDPALGSLHHAGNVLFDCLGRDEAKLGRKANRAGELRLFQGSGRAERSLHREGPTLVDVIQNEMLAFGRHRATNVPRDAAVASENLRASVVDVERVEADRADGEVRRLSPAGRSRNHEHPSSRHASSRLERRVRTWQHVGR